MVCLVFAGGMIFQGWFNTKPTTYSIPPTEIISGSASAPRSKQAINELLEEIGAILSVIERGQALLTEWRETVTNQNPERICLDLDSRTLQDKITAFINKLNSAQRDMAAIYEKNRIDEGEFNKVFGPGGTVWGYQAAAGFLGNYAHEI